MHNQLLDLLTISVHTNQNFEKMRYVSVPYSPAVHHIAHIAFVSQRARNPDFPPADWYCFLRPSEKRPWVSRTSYKRRCVREADVMLIKAITFLRNGKKIYPTLEYFRVQ